jgi:hypothetical protein
LSVKSEGRKVPEALTAGAKTADRHSGIPAIRNASIEQRREAIL